MNKCYKAHPVMILTLMKPFVFVLALPVLRGLAEYFITGTVNGVLLQEVLAFIAVLAVAYLKFRAFSIKLDGELITIKQGLFLKTESVIRKEKLSSVTSGRSIVDFIFGSVTYKINTEAGVSGRTDYSFKLRKKDAESLFSLLYGGENRTFLRFSALKRAIFAAASSSAVTGIIVGVPIVNNVGKILNVALSRILFDELNQVSSRFNSYFPPIVNLLTIILIAGYVGSFFITFLKMFGFRLKTGDEKIEIKSGVFLRKHTAFKKSAVNDVCIEQTPLMRVTGLYSVRAAVGGYGDKKGEKAIIIPAADRVETERVFNDLFCNLQFKLPFLSSEKSKSAAIRFLRPARLYAALDIGITALAAITFPAVSRLTVLIGLVVMAIIVYYGNLCLYNYRQGKLGFGDCVFAVGSYGLLARQLYCEKERIGQIKIIQTPADCVRGTCKAEITIRSESADKVRVRNINFKKTVGEIQKHFNIWE